MDLRRLLLIFVATALITKVFATALHRILPQEQIAAIERASLEKISNFFGHGPDNLRPAVVIPPHVSPFKSFKPVPLPKQLAFKGGVKTKKAPLVKPTPEQEKERRKQRTKKLEEAADKDKDKKKTPQLTVVNPNPGNDKSPLQSIFADGDLSRGALSPISVVNPPVAPIIPFATTPKVDLAMWEKLLSTQPTSSELKSFVALYKAGQISSHDYYSVLAQVQKSPLAAARQLAILGCSIEPNNDAFQILSHEKYSETDSGLQTLANQRLLVYQDVKYLSFLIQPLTQGDVYAKTVASDLVGQIALTIRASPQLLTADAKSWLNHYVSVLTPLTHNSFSALQASATTTLNRVKNILGLTA